MTHEHETDDQGRQICTTTGETPSTVRDKQRQEGNAGQHSGYIVLCDEERAKGFVRPYRDAYKHVGLGAAKYRLRDLTPEEQERHGKYGYVKYEEYPQPNPDGSSVVGKFWTQKELDSAGKGCRTVTTMGRALSETYARDPKFYGATYCVACGNHLPVEEFTWTLDDQPVGS